METSQLAYPITHDGTETTVLTLRRVTVGDLEAANTEKTDLDRALKLLQLSSGLSSAEVRELVARDFGAASDLVEGFLP